MKVALSLLIIGVAPVVAFTPNSNEMNQIIRLDGSTSLSKLSSSFLRHINVAKAKSSATLSNLLGVSSTPNADRRLDGDEEEEVTDDGASEVKCSKLMYTSVSFMVEQAENLPVPDSPSEMYTMLSWSLDDVYESTTNNETRTEAKVRTSSDTVTLSKRSAGWESDGFFTFDNVCGENKMIFQIFEENSGYLSAPDDGEEDTPIWRYSSQTSVDTYFDMVAEATSCWYIERSSLSNYDTPDSTYQTTRDVYVKWCVKVKCDEGYSCYQPLSTWALITVLALFLFPAALCLCCLCCMSQKTTDFFIGLNRLVRRILCCGGDARTVSSDSRGRVGSNSSSAHRRSVGQREVELQERRRPRSPSPSPPPRVNFIKKYHKETSLARLQKQGVELEDDAVCAICLGELEASDKVKQLACNHVFHAGCIDLWGESAHTCPLCKTDFERSNSITSDEAPMLVAGGGREGGLGGRLPGLGGVFETLMVMRGVRFGGTPHAQTRPVGATPVSRDSGSGDEASL